MTPTDDLVVIQSPEAANQPECESIHTFYEFLVVVAPLQGPPVEQPIFREDAITEINAFGAATELDAFE